MKTIQRTFCLAALTILLFLTAGVGKSSAQFFLGGETNVSFLNGINVDLAPIAGYKYQNFSAGVSPVIQYTATGETSGDFSYGGRIFVEYSIYKGIFGHAEFGAMNTGYLNYFNVKQRNWVLSAPVGVGYEKEITKGVWFKTMVLYDALLNFHFDYVHASTSNPSVRAGFTYSFK